MFELIKMVKNTRGKDSRPIEYMGIGKEVKRIVKREKDEEGKDLGKNADGTLITRDEEVTEITHEGVLETVEQALELVNGDTQVLLDCFAFGFNKNQYQKEADKDELDPFVVGLDEAKAKARKSAIPALAKTLEIELLEAAELVAAAAKPEPVEEVVEG